MNEAENSSNGGPSRFAEHNVVATFSGPEEARHAMVLLERKGVEGGDIELFGPGMEMAHMPVTNDEQRHADVEAIVGVEKRGGAGGVLGAVAGAVIGGVIAAVMSGSAGAIIGSALAGALLVGALGFLWGGFSGMAASEQFADTFASTGGETTLAVHSGDPDEIDAAVEALRGAAPKRIATCGPDGQLRDVA